MEAKQYEGKVRAGNILISVHTENSEERSRAKQALEEAGATDVSSTSEASVPKDSRVSERVVKAEFDGEVTRGASDASNINADEVDDARAPTTGDRSTIPTSKNRRPL